MNTVYKIPVKLISTSVLVRRIEIISVYPRTQHIINKLSPSYTTDQFYFNNTYNGVKPFLLFLLLMFSFSLFKDVDNNGTIVFLTHFFKEDKVFTLSSTLSLSDLKSCFILLCITLRSISYRELQKT